MGRQKIMAQASDGAAKDAAVRPVLALGRRAETDEAFGLGRQDHGLRVAPASLSPSGAFAVRPRSMQALQRAVGNTRAGQLATSSDRATDAVQSGPEASENKTGLPDSLKTGLENLSGMDFSGVRVHYNSARPAQFNALAYTQGQDIHIAPGQQKHLPHEGWHVVQQKRGRVRPTMEVDGVGVNDDRALEREADSMGERAARGAARVHGHSPETMTGDKSTAIQSEKSRVRATVIQRVTVDEVDEERGRVSKFNEEYPAWLQKNRTATGFTEADVVRPFDIDRLKEAADRHATHQRNLESLSKSVWEGASGWDKFWNSKGPYVVKTVSEFYVDHLAEGLLASATLNKYAGKKIGENRGALVTKLRTAIKVVDPTVYEQTYLKHVRDRGLDISNEFLLKADLTKGFRVNDAFYLRLGSGTPSDSLHVPIHESMHYFCDPLSKFALGDALNEGLTEIITSVVMKEAKANTKNDVFTWKDTAYASERVEVQKMMASTDLSQENLIEFYFSMINARSGVITKVDDYVKGHKGKAKP